MPDFNQPKDHRTGLSRSEADDLPGGEGQWLDEAGKRRVVGHLEPRKRVYTLDWWKFAEIRAGVYLVIATVSILGG